MPSGTGEPYGPPPWTPPSADGPSAQPWNGSPVPGEPSGPQWDTQPAPGTSSAPPWGTQPAPGPVPLNASPLPTAPIVPGAPPWQPPPAFTAAAAGMQVWPSSSPDAHGIPQWPAATGEPVWSDADETTGRPAEPGDVAVWPPSAVHGDGLDENTVNVRAGGSAVPARHERTDLAQASEPGAHAAGSPAGYPTSAPSPETGPYSADAPSPAEPGAHAAGLTPPQDAGLLPGRPQEHPSDQAVTGQAATPLLGEGLSRDPGHVPGQATTSGQGHPPAPSPDPGHAPGQGPSPETEHTPGSAPPAEPAAHHDGPAPATWGQPPQPEPTPYGPDSPGPVTHALASSSGPTQHLPTLPARPAEHDAPSLIPEPGDQPTPPGGIPVISPPFPPAVGKPSTPPASTSGEVVLRGPFTPPSAVVHEPPPPAEPPARKRGNTILIAAVVALVVGGTGTGAFFAYQSFVAKRSASADAPIPSAQPADPTDDPENPVVVPDPVNTEILNSEKTDPGKVTVADAFTKKITLAGTTFVRVKTDVTQKCDEAAAGRFASTLTNQDCRQVLRATYVDSKRKYAVTTGIAVLPSLQSAVEVDRAKNLGSNLWFRGLPGTPGSGAERVDIAGGYAAGLVWGRYIVFSYATFSDGHTPTAKEKNLGKVSGAFRDETAKVVERRVTS